MAQGILPTLHFAENGENTTRIDAANDFENTNTMDAVDSFYSLPM